ncbi:MAG: transcriptional regulator, partial [Alphaproteobacteria bacterium HGW-Alphaproteobacteria-10]
AGVELIAEGATSQSDGRGVRLKASDAARLTAARISDDDDAAVRS